MLRNGERQVAPELSGIRRDHVARYEFAAKRLAARSRVIDLACGIGYGSALLADAGHSVIGMDRSEEAIAYGREHYARTDLELKVRDVSKLRLERNSSGAAVCFETIEHLVDPLPMLRTLNKAARHLIASVPNETVFPHGGRILFHFRHYTRAEFENLLNAAGYRITGWFGQAGKDSEVVPELEGRTLIATAVRASKRERHRMKKKASAKPSRASKKAEVVPEHVSIVGLGPSCAALFELTRRMGGLSAYSDEVWGINAMGDVLRCDRVFHMDDVLIQEARASATPTSNIAAMLAWLKVHPGPIYTSVVRDGYPGLVAFPLEDVLNRKLDSNGGAPYFNSTAAYAIAYAIHIGVKKISLFGLDYTLPNSHRAEKGRACCEFWLGIAAARGIEIVVPETTSLLDACEPVRARLYGYDCVDVALLDQADGTVKVKLSPRDKIPTAAEVEAAYDHNKHPNSLMSKGR